MTRSRQIITALQRYTRTVFAVAAGKPMPRNLPAIIAAAGETPRTFLRDVHIQSGGAPGDKPKLFQRKR